MDGFTFFTLKEYLFPGPTKKEAPAFRDAVTSCNIRRQRVLAPLVIAACAVLPVLGMFFMKRRDPTGQYFLGAFVLVQMVTAIFMARFLLASGGPVKPAGCDKRRLDKAFAFTALSWAAISSGMMVSEATGSGPYLIAVLSFASVIFLETLQGIVLLSLAPLLFAGSAFCFGPGRNFAPGTCASILAATVFAYTISRINFVMLLRNFRDAEYIAGQKRELMESNERLHQLSFLDPLTNIANRRFLEMSLSREWRQQSRSCRQLSVIMIDIDWFKNYNDTYGHLDGDACLRMVAAGLKASLKRPSDLVTRFGGEEFCVLLPETERQGAISVGRRMLLAIRGMQLPHQGSPLGIVTVSMGLACCRPDLSGRVDDLLAAADAALYNAKTAGKDRMAWCCPGASPAGLVSGEHGRSFRVVEFNRVRGAGKLQQVGTEAESFQAVRY